MKKLLPLTLLFAISLFANEIAGQPASRYFDNVWHGFNTGYYPAGVFPSAIKVADLDNDGDPDVVASQSNLAKGFVVLVNQGNGDYAAPVSYVSPLAALDISVADFNADGLKDVVVSNTGSNEEGNSISVFFNLGNAVFGLPVNITVGSAPAGLATADLDGDGDIDIAVCNKASATVSIIRNNGNGTFGPVVSFPAGNAAFKLVVSRIDADNQVDLVIANEGVQKMNVLFNTGNGTFDSRVEYNVLMIWGGDMWSCVESADMDNDGDNDILYSSGKTFDGNRGIIAYFKNNGNGTLAPVISLPFTLNSGGSSDIEITDVNSDGWKDIIGNYYSGRETDNYQLLMNNGAGGFLPAVSLPAGGGTFSLASTDINNDTKPDILTLDRNSMQVTVHLNDGNGNFPVPVTYSSSNGLPGALDAADIDADGDLDLISSASSIAAIGVTVTVSKNNGNGTFSPAVEYSIGDGGIRAKFRDLNGDNFPDILFATAISSPPYNFHTAINNGNGTFGARQTWPANSCGWSDIDAVDMDNDGDRDVIITEWLGCPSVPLAGRRIYISENNGNGTFNLPLIKLVNPHPACLATGDFNEDGNTDLVTGQAFSVDLHLGTGTGDILAPVSFATEQYPYALVVRDFNNDGHADIATCTEFTYEGMSVLLGNGNGTFQPAQNYFGAFFSDLRNESGITAGDIDADGDIDVMVSNSASNDLSIYLNNGNGTFTFSSRVGIYYSAAGPIFDEFTGDCAPDLAAAVSLPFHLFDGGAITILTGNSSCVIPVQFLELNAAARSGNVEVSWRVVNEMNMWRYEVERSRDGRDFVKAGEINSRNSITVTRYSFLDEAPGNGKIFYRLKMIDIDGRNKYSPIVLINLEAPATINMSLTPNPSAGKSNLYISGNLKGKAVINIYDLRGAVLGNVYTGELDGTAFSTTLNFQNLEKGIYILRLTINNEHFSKKLVIQ